MSAQACVWEQGAALHVSGESPATVGISVNVGKKVRWSQSWLASSSASALASSRILVSGRQGTEQRYAFLLPAHVYTQCLARCEGDL